jgi:hypothetical protein
MGQSMDDVRMGNANRAANRSGHWGERPGGTVPKGAEETITNRR